MRYLLSLGFLYLSFFIVIKTTQLIVPSKQGQTVQTIDTSKYMIFTDSVWRKQLLGKNATYTTLTAKEINLIENLIYKHSLPYNAKEIKTAKATTLYVRKKIKSSKYIYHPAVVTDMYSYYKQFIPGFNAKGEKEVFVVCFCSADYKTHWKEFPVMVGGGGSCHFDVKLNLTRKTVSDFRVNAPL